MERQPATSLVGAFMRLFAGMDRAYGIYDLSKPIIREDGKRNGAAITKREPVTEELWNRHLSGKEPGIGIIPIMDGNDCWFGAIDIDVYAGLSHQSIVAKLARSKIPMVVCRTKSGGAHLYLFAKDQVTALVMRSKLSEIASFLGYGDCEIFPKQTQILSEQGDVGQWINMPYFGGMRGMRYAVDIEGNALSPEQFVDYAEEQQVDPAWFAEKIIAGNDFADGPPCLQALSQAGYPVGTRNDGLYNIAVYLRKSRPDSWENALEEYNHKFLEPPLTMPEVQGVAKSVKKKEYGYACSKQPICNHCNAALCRTRQFGVGGGAGGRFPLLGGLTKLATRPPLWYWSVDGVRMELTTSELQDPRAFQRRCMEYLNIVPGIPSRATWEAAVQHAMDTVTTVEAPADASPEGMFWDYVEKFCTSRAQAMSLDEIVLGKPYTGEGRTFFRMQDLLSYLNMHKFFDFRGPKIASLLNDAHAEHGFKNLKGRGVNFWSIPAFVTQTEGFGIPKEIQGEEAPF
jgi:hypothetical protein